MEPRGAAFARLFEAVHEGVYIGTISPASTSTIAANAHLKLIFGFASETPEVDVRPFETDRFVDPPARDALLDRLATDGAVTDYLLRLQRADGTAVWVELTARADSPNAKGELRVEALMRDVSERKKLDDETRDLVQMAYQRVKQLLTDHKTTLERIAHELRRHETLDAKQLSQILIETGINLAEVAPTPNAETVGLHEGDEALPNIVRPDGSSTATIVPPETSGPSQN